MKTVKICTLVIAAAFAAPGHAQKTVNKSETLLGTAKPAVIPKLEAPAPAAGPASAKSAIVPSAVVTGELLPAVQKSDVNGAGISAAELKPNIDLKGLAVQRPGETAPPEGGRVVGTPGSDEKGRSGFSDTKARMLGLEGEKSGEAGNSLFMGEGKSVVNGATQSITDAVGNQGPITGAKYGDTFGGNRVNRKTQGSVNDFSGGGRGWSSEGDSPDVTKAKNEGAADMVRREGGTPTGNWQTDIKEAEYAQKAGTDGYAATKNMTATERSNYWNAQALIQKTGTKRPTEDSTGTANGPMSREEFKANQRGIAGRIGGAGGSNDGRGEQVLGSSAGGGGMVVVNKADGPERVEGGGTINMNEALKINTLVNPGAANVTK
jgi:hypothetical protein